MQNSMNGKQSQKSASKHSLVSIFFFVYAIFFLGLMLYHVTFGPENLEGDKQVAIDGMFLFPAMLWGFTECNPSNSTKQ